jgi:hypothetical protein
MNPAGVLIEDLTSANGLQTTTAVIEIGAGLALLSSPWMAVELLLGAPLRAPNTLTLARVVGVALLTLGVAFLLARGDTRSPAARGLIAAMIVYNLGVAVILVTAGIHSQSVGLALWPAVVLHATMGIWCFVTLSSTGTAESSANLG